MTEHAKVTGAESCWDDGFQDDSDCEKYLQEQKAKLVAEEEVESDEYDDDAETENVSAESEEEFEGSYASAETEEESEDDDPNIEAGSDTTAKGKKMVAAKITKGKTTKADAIRAIISAKQDAGVEIRPRDVKAELEKKGIEVNSSQISITMRSMGLPPTKVGAGRPAGSGGAEKAKKRATAKIRAVPVEANGEKEEEAIEMAATLLRTAGSYDAALSALNLCDKIVSRS